MVDIYKPDVAFICNPTHRHIETAIHCAERGMPLFIEKPIGVNTKYLDYLIRLVVEHNIPTYVAYPFRFHKDIKKIKLPEKLYHCTIQCHTDMSKWRDYETYSAKSSQGGGALLELSHEIDLAEYLFGEVEGIAGTIEHTGNAPTDGEDFAELTLKHRHSKTRAVLNLGSKVERRTIGINSKIYPYETNDQMYLDQLRYFLGNTDNPKMMNCLPDASRLFRRIINFKEVSDGK